MLESPEYFSNPLVNGVRGDSLAAGSNVESAGAVEAILNTSVDTPG